MVNNKWWDKVQKVSVLLDPNIREDACKQIIYIISGSNLFFKQE
jgi:hypothetical protein